MMRALLLAAALATVAGVTASDTAAQGPLCVQLYQSAVPVESCVYSDLSTLVTNDSNVVISVRAGTAWTRMKPGSYSPASVSDWASYEAVPASCSTFGPCLLAPGRSLALWNHVYHPYHWYYTIDLQHTVARTMALALIKRAQQQFERPTRSTALKAVKCAANAASLVHRPQSWSNDVVGGVTTFQSCRNYWNAVHAPPAQEAALGEDAVDLAKTDIAGGEAGWVRALEFFGELFHR